MGFDVYTLIFLALAVFIFVRLRAVLGQRTGNERPPIERRRPAEAKDDTVTPLRPRPVAANQPDLALRALIGQAPALRVKVTAVEEAAA